LDENSDNLIGSLEKIVQDNQSAKAVAFNNPLGSFGSATLVIINQATKRDQYVKENEYMVRMVASLGINLGWYGEHGKAALMKRAVFQDFYRPAKLERPKEPIHNIIKTELPSFCELHRITKDISSTVDLNLLIQFVL
jgi:hypothetical protein